VVAITSVSIKMWTVLINFTALLSVGLTNVISNFDANAYFAKIQFERNDPCPAGSPNFTKNSRGCGWYWSCLEDPKREGLCPLIDGVQSSFDFAAQSCTYPEDVPCDFDDENRLQLQTTCEDRTSRIIPHPFECNKYSG
jgi:hypothetical protein